MADLAFWVSTVVSTIDVVAGADYKEIGGSRRALAWCMRFFAGRNGRIYAVFGG